MAQLSTGVACRIVGSRMFSIEILSSTTNFMHSTPTHWNRLPQQRSGSQRWSDIGDELVKNLVSSKVNCIRQLSLVNVLKSSPGMPALIPKRRGLLCSIHAIECGFDIRDKDILLSVAVEVPVGVLE